MYEIISNIINHDWNSGITGEQQIIYYICGVLIVVLTVTSIDFLYKFLKSFTKKGE